jgi:Relaxase/Mobilisation nuclease domain
VLAKILKHGSGSGSRALSYLLADKDHTKKLRENPPELLRGDPETAAALIDSLGFAQRYTSGVLSFTEEDAVLLEHFPEIRFELIDSFERDFLVPGMDPNRLSMVWIQHRDHDRTELHFVVANVDLETGKRFPAYFDRADRTRLASWQDVENLSRGMDDPRDPDRRRAIDHAKKLPQEKADLAAALEKMIAQKCGRGELEDRAAIVDFIRAKSLEVGRQGKDYITVLCGDGKNDRFRLKGELFSENYRFDRSIRARSEPDGTDRKEDAARRAREAEERLGAAVQRRREYLEKRFGDDARIHEERRLGKRLRDERAARDGEKGREGVDPEVLLGGQGGSRSAGVGDVDRMPGDDRRLAGMVEDPGPGARPHEAVHLGHGREVDDGGRADVVQLRALDGDRQKNQDDDHLLSAVQEGGVNEHDPQRSGSPVARLLAAVESGIRGARDAFDRSVHALHDRARTAIQGFRRALSGLDQAIQRNHGPQLQHRRTAQEIDAASGKALTRIEAREELARGIEHGKRRSKGHDISR